MMGPVIHPFTFNCINWEGGTTHFFSLLLPYPGLQIRYVSCTVCMPSLKSTLPLKIVGSKTTFFSGSRISGAMLALGSVYMPCPACSSRNLSALPTQLAFHLNGVAEATGKPKRMGLQKCQTFWVKNLEQNQSFWADFQVEITPCKIY